VAVDKRGFGRALRFRSAGSAGTDHAGYFAVDDPLVAEASEPVDMAQVRADDLFIEALANANRSPDPDPVDERMAALLLSWRDDVNSESIGPVVGLDTAVAAIRNAPRPPVGRQLFGTLAAAAAVLVIAFTGVGLAARDAVPGTPLFGVTKVLYSDKAKSVEAAIAIRTQLEAASVALASGRVDEAQAAIVQAQEKLPVVAAEDGQGALVAQTEQLIAQLENRLTPAPPAPAPASDSPAPLVPPEITPAPTTQPTVETTTSALVTTMQAPPTTSTPDSSVTTAPSATAEGPSSPGTPSLQPAPGSKSGESASDEPLGGTSSQGAGPSGRG
jgi:Anti-sigma-D factor RsdA to sigma factor binding region